MSLGPSYARGAYAASIGGNTLHFRNMLVAFFERIQPFFNCG